MAQQDLIGSRAGKKTGGTGDNVYWGNMFAGTEPQTVDHLLHNSITLCIVNDLARYNAISEACARHITSTRFDKKRPSCRMQRIL